MSSTDKNLHLTRKERDYLSNVLVQRYNFKDIIPKATIDEREILKQLIAKLDMVPLWD